MLLTFRLDKMNEVEGFTDSDYARNSDNRKSMLGYVFTYRCGSILWRLKLQDYMTLSMIEAEYIATSEATKEAIWLHRLSTDFSAKSQNGHLALTLYCNL